jgi:hypothetical protein
MDNQVFFTVLYNLDLPRFIHPTLIHDQYTRVRIDYTRPPIGETRIIEYDGKDVTFAYLDHHTKTQHQMTLPVFDFIKRLISHVPDRYFRIVRYYNWLSNRTRKQYLPFVYQSLKQIVKEIIPLHWRTLFIKAFRKDPLLCHTCNTTMVTAGSVYTHNLRQLRAKHQAVTNPNNHY